jgi:hypothetical protein
VICVIVNPDGSLSVDSLSVPPSCSQYELLTPVEQNNTALLYQQYFGFDAELFSLVLISCFSVYAMGLSIGLIWKWLNKV